MSKIFTENIKQEQKEIKLEPGERLYVEDDKGNRIQVGFTNNGDIVVHSADEKGNALQVQPIASNCIYLRTARF